MSLIRKMISRYSRASIGRVFRRQSRTHTHARGRVKKAPSPSPPRRAVYNYDHQALYSRGEKNGRLKNQMTASGDVMTMRCPPLPTPEVPATSEKDRTPHRAGVIRRRLLRRVTNK